MAGVGIIFDNDFSIELVIHCHSPDRRQWIGVDITYLAIQVIVDRLTTWLPHAKFSIDGIRSMERSAHGNRLVAHLIRHQPASRSKRTSLNRRRSGTLMRSEGKMHIRRH